MWSQDGNAVKSYSRKEFTDFLVAKILSKGKVDETCIRKAIDYAAPCPGYILEEGQNENFAKDICQLCCHIPCYPGKCYNCGLFYCQRCMLTLISLRNLLENRPYNLYKLEEIYEKKFKCLNCPPRHSICKTLDPGEKADMRKLRIQCRVNNCKFSGDYTAVIKHNCNNSAGLIKFSTNYLGEIFKNQEDPVFAQPYNTRELTSLNNQPDNGLVCDTWVRRYANDLEPDFSDWVVNKPNSPKRSAPDNSDEPPEKRPTSAQSNNESQVADKNWNPSENEKSPTSTRQSNDTWGLDTPESRQRDIEFSQQLMQNYNLEFGKAARRRERRHRLAARKRGEPIMLMPPPKPAIEILPSQKSIQQIQPIQQNQTQSFTQISQPSQPQNVQQSVQPSQPVQIQQPVQQPAQIQQPIQINQQPAQIIQPPQPSQPIQIQRQRQPVQIQSNQVTSSSITSPSSSDISRPNSSLSTISSESNSSSVPSTRFIPPNNDYQLIKYNPIAHPRDMRKKPSDFNNWKSLMHFYKRHKDVNWNNRKRNANRRRILSLLSEKKKEVVTLMAPPKDYAKAISNATNELQKTGLKVCAMDAEMIRIRMRNAEIYSVPVWIAIVDGAANVVYHEFVRHNTAAIVDWNQDAVWHGLDQKDVAKAKGFRTVRREVLNIFRQYDRIIVCGQTVDFAALFLTMDDYYQILPKIFCVNSYFNCRSTSDALGLKYCSYILFGSIMQRTVHSPLVDAAYTMYCYLIDFARAEQVHARVIKGPMMARGHGFRCFIYPKNQHMAGRLHAVMKIVNDWPGVFKVNPFMNKDTRLIEMLKKSYDPDQYIEGTQEKDLPPPYTLTPNEMINFAMYKLIHVSRPVSRV